MKKEDIFNEIPAQKPRVVLYFRRGNDDIAKTFAVRARNTKTAEGADGADCIIVWEQNFRDVDDCLTAAAVVIQADSPNAQKIADAYAQRMPDVEVHYMTPEGSWAEDEGEADVGIEEVPAAGQEPPVQAEAPDEAPVALQDVSLGVDSGELAVDPDSDAPDAGVVSADQGSGEPTKPSSDGNTGENEEAADPAPLVG